MDSILRFKYMSLNNSLFECVTTSSRNVSMPVVRHTAKKKKRNQYEFEFKSEEYVPMDLYRALEQRVRSLEMNTGWTEEKAEELSFPREVLEKLPQEVRKTVEGVMFNYRKDYPNFSFWGMRKALIDAIRIRFKIDGKEDRLYDKDGDAYKLPKWIELAKQEKYISSYSAKHLKDQVKVFGDTASHDYMADLHKEEVPLIFTQLRIALARMYYEEK